MTNILSGKEISAKLIQFGDINEYDDVSVWVPKNEIFRVCDFLKNDTDSKLY